MTSLGGRRRAREFEILGETLNINPSLALSAKVSHLRLDLFSMRLLSLLFMSALAGSHVPLMAGDNDNISRPMHISDADKSWTVFSLLPGRP